MSALAKTLLAKEPVRTHSAGPTCSAFFLYQNLDEEDYEAISLMKSRGITWKEIQQAVDQQLNITDPIHVRRFTYHVSGECSCIRPPAADLEGSQ